VIKVTTNVQSAVFRPRHNRFAACLLLKCSVDNTLFDVIKMTEGYLLMITY